MLPPPRKEIKQYQCYYCLMSSYIRFFFFVLSTPLLFREENASIFSSSSAVLNQLRGRQEVIMGQRVLGKWGKRWWCGGGDASESLHA